MSKWQKMLIIVFCAGMLLCGFGAGIFFTEFSGLSYGGKQFLGETDMRTENFDVQFVSGEGRQDIASYWGLTNLQVDDSIPKNTVRFCVTYNAGTVTPFADWNKDNEQIFLSYYWHDTYDDIAYIMEAKDVVLQNLKEGKLVSLDELAIEEVTILVNSETEENIWVPGLLGYYR